MVPEASNDFPLQRLARELAAKLRRTIGSVTHPVSTESSTTLTATRLLLTRPRRPVGVFPDGVPEAESKREQGSAQHSTRGKKKILVKLTLNPETFSYFVTDAVC